MMQYKLKWMIIMSRLCLNVRYLHFSCFFGDDQANAAP